MYTFRNKPVHILLVETDLISCSGRTYAVSNWASLFGAYVLSLFYHWRQNWFFLHFDRGKNRLTDMVPNVSYQCCASKHNDVDVQNNRGAKYEVIAARVGLIKLSSVSSWIIGLDITLNKAIYRSCFTIN